MRRGWVKGVCALLCVLTLSIGAFGGAAALSWYAFRVDERGIGGFYESAFCWRVTDSYCNRLEVALSLRRSGEERELSYSEKRLLEELTQALAAENTNFRYRYQDSQGKILASNVPEGQSLEEAVYAVFWDSREVERYDSAGEYAETEEYRMEYGVAVPLTAEDEYQTARDRFVAMNEAMPKLALGSAAALAAGLVLLILLIRVAGRRQGREEVVLNLQDRVPYDLYLAAAGGIIVLLIVLGDSAAYHWNRYQDTVSLVAFGVAVLGTAVVSLAAILTTATRLKARTLLRNTVIWRICLWVWRRLRGLGSWWKETFGSWDVTRRVILLFLLYLLGSVVTSFTIILAPFYQGVVLYGLCKWLKGWKAIRAGTGRILGGEPEAAIDLAELDRPICRELKAHAEELNDLGGAINSAVEERMKSERMKAELITNVSHDLKTPLTSIINYVDLLKKEDISNERAAEYIEVLDRKSQRLKKLTEDLVEASKASTGALVVNKEKLELGQLLEQARGEYEEKLAQGRLTLVADLPPEPLWVEADGRHLWRVLDNLLGNCVKYALEGTRVYLTLERWDGQAVLTLKNISREELNISADRLLERFVRGDESRTSEGSGLGLSIAKSLTELQGGSFSLAVDGDLFKATVRLPLVPSPDGKPASA